MFTEIKKIKNIGSFKDFTGHVSLEQNNIFYALNGYGKTTLTSIIHSIKDNDYESISGRKTLGESGDLECIVNRGSSCYKIEDCEWKCNGASLSEVDADIVIFDDNYINKNIFSEKFEIEHKKSLHKIIFGDKGIKLNQELNTLQLEGKNKKEELTVLASRFINIEPYNLKDYIGIDISKLDETKLKNRKKIIESDIKNINEQTQIKSKENLKKLSKFSYDLDSIKNIFLTSKVSGKAHEEAKKKVEIFKMDYFNDASNADSFVKYGLENIKNDTCSFCHQDLSGEHDLLEVYKKYFDIEYEKILKELNSSYQSYKQYNFDLDINKSRTEYTKNINLYDYWKKLLNLEDLADMGGLKEYIEKIVSNNKDVLSDLEDKLKDLNTDFNSIKIGILIDSISQINSFIDDYNLVIERNMTLIDEFQKGLTSSKLNVLNKEKKDIEVKIVRLQTDEVKKIEEIKKKRKEIDVNIEKMEKKRKELNDYTVTIVKDYEDLINKKLVDLGVISFKIGHIIDTTHVNGSYVEIVVEINGKNINLKDHNDKIPSFKNTLSRGDKNSLAFAFFLAFLENNPNKRDLVLIFDDPLSSHDENRQRQTVNQIKELSCKVKQSIVLTHKKDFLTLLNKVFKNESTYFQLLKNRVTSNSSIVPLDISGFLSSEFEKIIEKLEKYLQDTTLFSIGSIQNDLRKIFEDVFRLKYYQVLRRESRTIFTYNTLNDNFFSRGLLQNIKQDLIDVSSYVNDGSHFTETSGNEDELCGYIEKSLKLIQEI